MKASERAAALPAPAPTRIPQHVAIIMDGNGRWARERGLPRMEGHRAGREAVRRTLEACRDLAIGNLTLYAFSTENWRRSSDEVEALMLLLRESVASEAEELVKNGIRLRISGDLDRLPPEIAAQLRDVMGRTRHNERLVLNFALNYGGRGGLPRAGRRAGGAVGGGPRRARARPPPRPAAPSRPSSAFRFSWCPSTWASGSGPSCSSSSRCWGPGSGSRGGGGGGRFPLPLWSFRGTGC